MAKKRQKMTQIDQIWKKLNKNNQKFAKNLLKNDQK